MTSPSSASHSVTGTAPRFTNRLIDETSPYLLQHAHNPVDWYPWGEEAFAMARAQDKPVHVSIGYSSCHWCHVLAHESFEDVETAQLLNARFVNIKVDREERPDIDRIYQIAQHLITRRSGGWPLTMFLTPQDRRPFFGGTYFPPQPRFGLPAFREVLTRVADYFATHRAQVDDVSEGVARALGELETPRGELEAPLDASPVATARAHLSATFDAAYGGFGGAPKFPHALTLELLLRRWEATTRESSPDQEALDMVNLTLRRMGEGGLYDQLGGGFARYSVDPQWSIPHFEKMLYDNGALVAVYAEAALATGDPLFARLAAETAEWVMRELQSPEGGYYSSIDADSEGHEGRYYVWDRADIEAALPAQQYAAFASRFGLDQEPNFEGLWHLSARVPLEEVARRLELSPDEAASRIDAARRTLLAIRAGRVPPARDEKILVSWNALMIRAMAIAARVLGRADFADSATRALEFIRRTHWQAGRLLATSREGRAHLDAYLDDYAFLADAILELQQVHFDAGALAFARELLERLLVHFADPGSGGLYFTSDEHETLILRPLTFGDDATPSGNGVAARALQRMGYLLGEPRYLDAAEAILRAGWSAISRDPTSHVALLIALMESLEPPEIVILRGEAGEIERWRRELGKTFRPRRLTLAIAADASELPAALAEKRPHGRAVAYLCRGSTCSAPLGSLAELARACG